MDDPVAELAEDTTHGSAWLSLFALDALRERAAGADDYDAVATFARRLRDARPAMHAVANRVNAAMAAADRTPAAVAASVETVRDRAARADDTAADRARERLGDRVLTLSRSGTVRDAIAASEPERVYVLESRPGGEGIEVAADLAEDTPTTLAPDAAVADVVAADPIDTLLTGADAVYPDGSVRNKLGTRTAATVAGQASIAVIVVTAAAKIAPTGTAPTVDDREPRDAAELYDGDAPVDVRNDTFDRTPATLTDAVVTERGALTNTEITAIADEHATLAAWGK